MHLFRRLLLSAALLLGQVAPGFATQIFVVSGTSQTSPADWCNSNNTVEGIGAGASGAASNNSTNVVTGGGAGEYRKIANFTVATPGTTAFNYTIGTGGTAITRSTAGSGNGNDGVQVTFETTQLVAKPGLHGIGGANPQVGGTGGTGGTGAAGNANGGAGGASGSFSSVATGGGGAGGSTGAGNAGVAGSGATSATNGGSGDAGSGGGAGTSASSAGAATATAGGDGAEWDATHGSGGGGGGGRSTSATGTGGAGGNYGGGGGAGQNTSGGANGVSGAGIQGILLFTYAACSGSPKLPLLGVGSLSRPAIILFDRLTHKVHFTAILDSVDQLSLSGYLPSPNEERITLTEPQYLAEFSFPNHYPDLSRIEAALGTPHS